MQKVIHKGPCIYFLLKDKRVIYIGQTVDLKTRIATHKRYKSFDNFRFIPCLLHKMDEYESRLINYFNPILNIGTSTTVGRISRGKFCNRIQLRLPDETIKLAMSKCVETNRRFSNYIETLILEDCKK